MVTWLFVLLKLIVGVVHFVGISTLTVLLQTSVPEEFFADRVIVVEPVATPVTVTVFPSLLTVAIPLFPDVTVTLSYASEGVRL